MNKRQRFARGNRASVITLGISLVLLAATQAYSHPTGFGNVLVAGGNWCQGQGVDVYWNGEVGYVSWEYNYVNGVKVGMKWQCVELAQRLYTVRGWRSGLFPVAYAYQIWSVAEGMGMVRHPKGDGYVPVPGDMMVFDNSIASGYGDVAVVDYVTQSDVYVCGQNWSTNGRRSYARSSIPSYCYGWVHDPDNHLGGCTFDPSSIWLSFGASCPGCGTQAQPLCSLDEAILKTATGGTLHIRNSSSWTGTLSKAMTLQAWDGPVTIGQ